MIILIRLKTVKTSLIIMSILIVCLLSLSFLIQYTKTSTTYIDESINEMLIEEIDHIFKTRNDAFLSENRNILGNLYNLKVRNGLWAYEHELQRMKYLHMWSDKQSVEFKTINSDIVLRNIASKGEGFSLNLLVSTEYVYAYNDVPNTSNSFRIGTYHSLDLMPSEEGWFITREWYTDPFADSLHLDEINSEKNKEFIISQNTQDLTNLNDRRKKAVDYAHKYCGAASLPQYEFSYNSEYRNYNPKGGDCANFASQILLEGGKFSKNRTWNYERGSGSKAWVNAHAFNSYMIYSNRASIIARGSYNDVLKPSYKLLPGDYIAYEKKRKVAHISVVTGVDSKGYALVNSHNSDRYKTPWDLGWSNKDIKFWLVRVHY